MIDKGFFFTTSLSFLFATLTYLFLYVDENSKLLKTYYFEVWLYFIFYGLNFLHLWKLFCSKITKAFECGFYGHLSLSVVIWIYGFVVLGLSYTKLPDKYEYINTALIVDQLIMLIAAVYEVWSIQDTKQTEKQCLLPHNNALPNNEQHINSINI